MVAIKMALTNVYKNKIIQGEMPNTGQINLLTEKNDAPEKAQTINNLMISGN